MGMASEIFHKHTVGVENVVIVFCNNKPALLRGNIKKEKHVWLRSILDPFSTHSIL